MGIMRLTVFLLRGLAVAAHLDPFIEADQANSMLQGKEKIGLGVCSSGDQTCEYYREYYKQRQVSEQAERGRESGERYREQKASEQAERGWERQHSLERYHEHY